MSSSTFAQRWTSVNDLTANNNNNKQVISFFLQASSLTDSNTFTPRPSKSLLSLVEPLSSSLLPPPLPPLLRPRPTGSSQQTRPVSSRVADIINRFESHSQSSMNNNSNKVFPPTRSIVTQLSEGNSSRNPPVTVRETSSIYIPLNSKQNNKPQPIIVYERITNSDRLYKSPSTSPSIASQSPLVKTCLENQIISQQNVESDTDSAIHTMPAAIESNTNYSTTISRSSTTDSSCSSLSSSDCSQDLHYSLPPLASTQKQRDINLNSTYFKQIDSFSSSHVTIPTRITPLTTSLVNENLESSQLHSLTTRFCSSEVNIPDRYRQLSSFDAIHSDTNLSQNSTNKRFIDTNLPLRYKRDSFIRLYGPDALFEHSQRKSPDVVLEDDIDAPFASRKVVVQKDKPISDQYELLEFLGRGKFGEVKKCRERNTKQLLAAKFITINKEQDRTEAFNEIEIMKALQHPRLLQLYDAFETKSDICLIMELITGGELFERVIDDDFILTERLCELYAMQICEGVNFMHTCNIIHLDMKPENILCLNRNGHRIKIIDFGLARKYDPDKQLKVLFGTPEFVAPEVINFDRIGYGTDMWSVGVICYVLLSGLSPFMGENDNDTYANINRVNYDFDDEAFTDISDEAKDFIAKLLLKNKDKRLQAKECLAHPWLTRRPKLATTPNDEEGAEKKISTKKLRRFVIRRRWQKAVNALLALKRMGMTL
ncbi:unnamed protein product [Rotaria sordida]|uniref:Protein kinase domain-containing protein n=1 Tax=Rotaria sordida TaxID=392033 RepID=A0A818T9J2_9BILA|nr:unnamed protein product [Rotaria sordida]CAF3683853.1 unnamed protein product [Rotaria sordida]